MFDDTTTTRGTLADLEANVGHAMGLSHGGTFIAQLVHDADLFVQFTSEGHAVLFDFPVHTPRQQQFDRSIRQIAADLRLSIDKSNDSLQVPFEGSVAEVTRIAREFLQRVYNIGPSTALDFQTF